MSENTVAAVSTKPESDTTLCWHVAALHKQIYLLSDDLGGQWTPMDERKVCESLSPGEAAVRDAIETLADLHYRVETIRNVVRELRGAIG